MIAELNSSPSLTEAQLSQLVKDEINTTLCDAVITAIQAIVDEEMDTIIAAIEYRLIDSNDDIETRRLLMTDLQLAYYAASLKASRQIFRAGLLIGRGNV